MTAVLALCAMLACSTTPVAPDTVGPRVPDRFADMVRPRVSEAPRTTRARNSAASQDTAQRARDRWLAIDKAQHFAMAYGTAMVGYGVLRGADVSHRDAQTAALAGSLAIGVGKELVDRARGGAFSFKDLTMDALGTLAAWGMLSLNR